LGVSLTAQLYRLEQYEASAATYAKFQPSLKVCGVRRKAFDAVREKDPSSQAPPASAHPQDDYEVERRTNVMAVQAAAAAAGESSALAVVRAGQRQALLMPCRAVCMFELGRCQHVCC
jgi:hypothetical protein